MTFYGSVVEADSYHSARGNTAWANGTNADKEAALLRASEYIDARYESMWTGWPVNRRAQIRNWPRSAAYDIYGDLILENEIPTEIEDATYELALIELVTPGKLNPVVTMSDRKTSVSVEGAVSVTYANTSGIESYRPVVTVVDGILAPLMAGDGAKSSLAGRMTRSY